MCFTLSFYILILSFIPCADASECDIKQTTSLVSQNHSEHEHDSETCSPFCICVCCGFQGYTIPFTPPIKIAAKYNSDNLFIFYKLFFINHFSSKIWQPPKIS